LSPIGNCRNRLAAAENAANFSGRARGRRGAVRAPCIVGAGLKVDRVRQLEGSCLTFTPNTKALHSVPMATRGRASLAQTRAPPNRRRAALRRTLIGKSSGRRVLGKVS